MLEERVTPHTNPADHFSPYISISSFSADMEVFGIHTIHSYSPTIRISATKLFVCLRNLIWRSHFTHEITRRPEIEKKAAPQTRRPRRRSFT